MKICNINYMVFNGKIIDSHTHVGNWYGKKYDIQQLDVFTKQNLKNGDTIEKMFISNLNCIDKTNRLNEADGLKEILTLTENNPKYAVIAVCQPNLTQGNVEEIDKVIAANRDKVFGLKFHPHGLECTATDACYTNYVKYAQSKQLPCLFHTDSKGFSNVQDIYKLAKTIPDTPVILGHCGGYEDFDKAVTILKVSVIKNDAKLYCDISWLDWQNDLPDGSHARVKKLIDELKEVNGLDRILFGTDAPLGCFGENAVNGVTEKEAYEKMVIGIKTMIKNNYGDKSDEITEKIFYKNADDLFFKKTWAKKQNSATENVVKKSFKTKAGLIIAAITTAVAAIACFLFGKNKDSAIDNNEK